MYHFFRFFYDKKNLSPALYPVIRLHFYDILLLIYQIYYYICENNRTKSAYEPIKYFRIVNIHRWNNWYD